MGQLDFTDRLFLARLLTAMLTAIMTVLPNCMPMPACWAEHHLQHLHNRCAVADPVMGKALGEVSLGNVLGQIFQLQRGFPLKCSRSSICCKKPMMAEGVARQLNPDADMWTLARPLAASWMVRPAWQTGGGSGAAGAGHCNAPAADSGCAGGGKDTAGTRTAHAAADRAVLPAPHLLFSLFS